MNRFSEFESALASAKPVPCPVDSLGVMFQAGVEQERMKQKKFKRLLQSLAVACCILLLSTCGLAFWNTELRSKNMELAKVQASIVSPNTVFTQSDSESDTTNRAPTWTKQDSEIFDETGRNDLVRKREQESDDVNTTVASQSTRYPDVSETATEPRFYRDSIFSMASGENVGKMMMRGVTFSDAEHYRDARFVKADWSTLKGVGNDSKSKSTANLPYVILREQINQGKIGL